ncbi:MAG: alkaline phosphatase family protein [Victivallales bacterium]|nr:alkaline phosphatase family protein [Victivallales bacterium]
MSHKIIVFSCDAMVWEDVEYLLKNDARFSEFFQHGSMVKRMRTIYPSITYPAHVSMMSGCYPDKHGVIHNLEFHPGMLKAVPWNWWAKCIKVPDVFTVAKRLGKVTGNSFWPVTANHPDIDYNLPEYWPQGPDDTKEACYKRAGCSDKLWQEVAEKHMRNVTIRVQPETDQLLVNCACDMIRLYKPDFFAMHTGCVDHYRHKSGMFSDLVTTGVNLNAKWFFDVVQATIDAGTFQDTNFFLTSDHGQMDIVRSVNINVLLADHGLITVNDDGSLKDWQAYCHSTGMSAQIKLRNPDDKETWKKTYDLLNFLKSEGVYGVGDVFTAEEVAERDHLADDFSFVIETDGYTSFSENWKRPLIKTLDFSDYRFGYATHGYYPTKGPQPVFLAVGPDIKQGVVIERGDTVDQAPTYAKLLGGEMPWADGKPIDDFILNPLI